MSDLPPSTAHLRGAVDLSGLVNRPQAPAGAAPGAPGAAPAAPGAPVQVPSLTLAATDATFGDVLELSMQVPVIVDLGASWAEQSREFTALLQRVIRELGGRLVLTSVEAEANPQLAQAFRAQSVPTVAALVGGQPVPLFAGILPEDQLRGVLEQVLALAAQNGVAGVAVAADGGSAEPADEPAPTPLPPHHAEAYAAIETGDYQAAIGHYKTALAQNPGDHDAVAGLAQASLLARLQGKTLDAIRSAAAAAPNDLDAVLDVADLDLSGGHIDDAFDRLLTLFPRLDAPGKNRVRERLLELFEVVGIDDPRVSAARRRLTSLLY
ncbi:tetratricopeptide repeat protein [Rathayibacter sp. YIM 133350]|uniref:tetratricopeptide repeat protein n=1 Tax=Rathayibacter sp. YIM 133350 TaxID=3131992 RepID=UPI00307DE5A2